MNAIGRSIIGWFREVIDGWDRFWFTPAQPHTLALIRIFGGAMMFYTHLVWALDLMSFVGPNSWITTDLSRRLHEGTYAWSYLWYVDSPALIWTLHIAGLMVFAALTVGLFSRVSSVLACIITISYCHRLQGALFGLDQVNAMLALYLMIGPCGAVYSVDHWRQRRRSSDHRPRASRSGNIAIRLIQLHMCIMYLFAGVAKMRGETWWDGSALWFAVANLEYQSMDLTWMVRWPILISAITHATVFWETFYAVLIWPRLTRPIFLLMAVLVHGGIALALGMITFGLAMLIGNCAFIPPHLVEAVFTRLSKRSEITEAESAACPATG